MPVQSSQEVRNNQARELDALWNAYALKYDNYYTDISPEYRDILQQAIVDWQNWYFSDEQFDNWGPIDSWIEALAAANRLLDSIIARNTLQAKAPVNAPPPKTVTVLEETRVTGFRYVKLGIAALVIGLVHYGSRATSVK